MGRNNLTNVLAVGSATGQVSLRTRFTHRPCGRHRSTSRRNSLSFSVSARAAHAASATFIQRNSMPSTHMRCMTTAIRRAKAMIALFIPRCRATFMPQAFSHDLCLPRTSAGASAGGSGHGKRDDRWPEAAGRMFWRRFSTRERDLENVVSVTIRRLKRVCANLIAPSGAHATMTQVGAAGEGNQRVAT